MPRSQALPAHHQTTTKQMSSLQGFGREDGDRRRMQHDGTAALSPIRELRFLDLCAGLGGFHLALRRAEQSVRRRTKRLPRRRWTFRCVLAADILPRLREAYVQNFPGLAEDYRRLYPPEQCAAEGLDDLYDDKGALVRIHGDLSTVVDVEAGTLRQWSGTEDAIVPPHDLLCAGFPCQPFSKSGAQLGFEDLNGTVFQMLAVILKERRPSYVFLENVGNFERHDKGNTWRIVHEVLEQLGYSVRATTTVGGESGGLGLLSPHHLGLPQHRERFFIVAQHASAVGAFQHNRYPFPLSYRSHKYPAKRLASLERDSGRRLRTIINRTAFETAPEEVEAAQLSAHRVRCVDHWRDLLRVIDQHDARCEDCDRIRPLPSFPIWGFELDPWNHYPFDRNPQHFVADRNGLEALRREWLRCLGERLGSEVAPRGKRSFLASSLAPRLRPPPPPHSFRGYQPAPLSICLERGTPADRVHLPRHSGPA